MIFVYIAGALLVIYFFYISVIVPKQKEEQLKILFEGVGEKYVAEIVKIEKRDYDYEVRCKSVTLLVKIAEVPSNSAITINSKTTWSLTWGGSSKNPGRQKTNQKYLTQLESFLKYELEDEKIQRKVILVYRDTEKIQRYLNESDIELVESQEKVYDYYIARYKEFSDLVGVLQKELIQKAI